MSKKNKKNHELDSMDQARMLKEINDAIYNGGSLPCTDEKEDHSIADMVDNFVMERMGVKIPKDLVETVTTESSDINDEEIESMDSMKNDVALFNFMNHIEIAYKKNEFSILSITDGVKAFSIDLNTIPYDKYLFSEKEVGSVGDSMIDDANVVLSGVISNFYPSIIVTDEQILDIYKHIDSSDDNRFRIYESEIDGIKFGYYIPNKSFEAWDAVVEDMIKEDKIVSFLSHIVASVTDIGFTFKELPDTYIKELMITNFFKTSMDMFKEEIYNDYETEETTEEMTDMVDVYDPSNDMKYEAVIENLCLMNVTIIDKMVDDEDDTDDSDELLATEEVEESEEDEDVESEDEVEDESAEEETDVEESDGDDIFGDDEEEISFDVKKPEKNTDDEFIVKRHK